MAITAHRGVGFKNFVEEIIGMFDGCCSGDSRRIYLNSVLFFGILNLRKGDRVRPSRNQL
jgi:hypothetical protein